MIKNNAGNVLVSYMIILPILLILVLTIIDFGLIIYYKTNALDIATTVSFKYKDNPSYDVLKEYVPDDFSLEIIKEDNAIYIDINKEYSFINPFTYYIYSDYKIDVIKKI